MALAVTVFLFVTAAGAHHDRALTLLGSGGLAAAEPEFGVALALAPEDKTIWTDYGIALADGGEPVRAEAVLAMALALDPSDAESWAFLGRIEKRLGRRARAQLFLERSVGLDPAGSAHHDLGDLALAAGDGARAEREYAADLATEPTCAEARTNRAALALARGDAAKAAAGYVTALAFHPDDPAARAGLERALAAAARRPRRGSLLVACAALMALALAVAFVRVRKRPAA